MKLLRFLFFFVFSIILFFAAVILFLGGIMALNEQFAAVVIHEITQVDNPPLIMMAGGTLFLLSLVVYSLSRRGNNQPQTYTFAGQKGPITISLRAIEDYVTKYLDEQHIAGNVKTKVSTTKNRQKLVVRASISVRSEQSMKNVGDMVQEEVAVRLREGLGLDNLDRVVVSVDKIISSKSSRSALPRPSAESFAREK